MIRRLFQPVLSACAKAPPTPWMDTPLMGAPPRVKSIWRYPLPHQRSISNTSALLLLGRVSETESSSTTTCWKCGKTISTTKDGHVMFFCPCEERVILPPTVTNYFTILECGAVRIDSELLKRKHTELQRELHPDKFTTKSQTEREYSAQQSALVNDAFATLSKPYSRGLYLMELNGVTISETDNYIASGERGRHLDFLEEVMEVRAEIHSLEKSTGDRDLARAKQLWEESNYRVQEYTREFEDCYEKDDFDGAKEALSKMKYYVTNSEMLYPLFPHE